MTKDYNKIINNKIDWAVEILNNSGLVAFPTETVYGLGANAEDKNAIKKVFFAKQRPENHPLIIHISHYEKINYWAKNISDDALKLAKHFWPGPLTLILQKQDKVLYDVTGGQETVALRVPRHPVALELLRKFNGLVGPSANKYGHVSPTMPQHVSDDLALEIDGILDGGECSIGIESTIVNCCDDKVEILREGIITKAHISQVLGKVINDPKVKQNKIRVPGATKSHYAPRKPLLIMNHNETCNLLSKIKNLKKCAVLSFHEAPNFIRKNIIWHTINKDNTSFAKNLYANLRTFEKFEVDFIIFERVPSTSNWKAISDRLNRASANSEYYLEEILNLN